MRRVFCIWLGLAALVSANAPSEATADQALLQQQSGDWAGAEKTWRALTAAAPADFRYWAGLGACLAHEQRLEAAVKAYRQALAINPKTPETQLNLGLAYFKMGQFEEAIGPLKVAYDGLPDPRQAELLLGMSLYGMAKYKDAIVYLSRTQQSDPHNSELELVLARSYLLSGSYEQARNEFEELLRRDPDSTQVHMLLGEAYDALGQSEDATREFEAAAKKGDLPDAHFALGFLLWRDKHLDAAAAEFEKELAADPKHFQALAYLGDIRLKQGDKEGADKLLRESVASKDGLWITHFDLGVLSSEQKRYPAAIAELQRAAKLDPKRADTHYRLAQIYKLTGQDEAAKSELRTVSQLHQQYNQDLILKVTGQAENPSAK